LSEANPQGNEEAADSPAQPTLSGEMLHKKHESWARRARSRRADQPLDLSAFMLTDQGDEKEFAQRASGVRYACGPTAALV
jgi:hypothetical protein